VDMFVGIEIWTCQRKFDKWFQMKVWRPMLTNGPTSCLRIVLRCNFHDNTLGTINIQQPHPPIKEKTWAPSLQVVSTHWLQ
jgi:hypothetical protein